MSVVGIDLGTTNTVVSAVRGGKVHVLADEHGQRLLPSVVSFHPNGEVLVGGAARARRVIDPRNTVYSHKRLIGRSWGSPEIVQAKQRYAFELREGPGQGPLVHARGQDYTLPEMSAFVLKRAKQIAETALGQSVERAVITVPAHFNELQRASTKVAGRVSGLEVLRILNEPTAAALAYGLGRSGNERVAVYDFGGGTFDCTLLDLSGNVFEVLATAGDSFLGGDDVDTIIAERMAESFLKAHRIDPRTDPTMLERLRTCAEEIKVQLSTAETHTVVLKEMAHGLGGSSIHFTFTMSRRDLEAAMTPLVDRTFKVTQDALSLARLTPTGFDKVILVGGSTRMPLVRKRVEAFFGTAPMDRVNPDEVVAIGAAIQAAALTEGQKRKSIPAPPPVPNQPRTLPGAALANPDAPTSTQVAAPKTGPSFGSAPPSFGKAGPPSTKAGPPPTAGGRAPLGPSAGTAAATRKVTAPGVAPAPGSRAGAPPSSAKSDPTIPGHPENDDPSFASFPDLSVPTPFEWNPSSPASDRSVGTVPGRAPVPSEPERSFGDFSEPSSLVSTPSASLPSFPSFASGTGTQQAPVMMRGAEPEPFADFGDLSLDTAATSAMEPSAAIMKRPPTAEEFGRIRDLSLVSTAGVQTPRRGPASDAEFGQIRDLSIASASSETKDNEALTEARRQALAGPFGYDASQDDDTAAMMRGGPGGTVDLGPSANPGARPPPVVGPHADEAADLPAVASSMDLPSVARGKPAPPRRPSQVGMTSGGGSAMLGKPPPVMAPQPFGPMARVEEGGPPSRTAATQARPPSAPPAKPFPPTQASPARAPQKAPPPFQASTTPMQARPAPHNVTAPLGARPSAPPAAPAPFAATLASPMGAPPPGFPGGSAPPPPPHHHVTAPMQQAPYGSAPPPPMSPSGSNPYATSQPTQVPHHGAYGSAPPPPIFGHHPSSPPGTSSSEIPLAGPPHYAQHAQHAPPHHAQHAPPQHAPPQHASQAPPRTLQYAAPVLVDVTPRGLVVETAGGYTDTIIPRNAKIPCERTRRFATGRDMQTTVRVRVAQGEHGHFPQNTFLGEVELSGLRPAPRGEVVVAVTFEVDADGTLRVRARDVQTGQEARATLQLVGVADESSVVLMINRFAQQPVTGNGPAGPS